MAIQQVCEEKGLTPEDVKATIEDALAAAFRKDFGDKRTQNIKVEFELATGKFKVFDVKEVVENELKEKYEKLKAEIEAAKEAGEEIKIERPEFKEGEEEEKKFNLRTMISLKEAKEIKKKYKVGDEVIAKLEVPAEFGRMAAQTAKQVIIQKLREAERNTVYNEYKEKVSELVIGTVQRQEGKIVLVELGNATAVMLPADQVRTDKYRPGARMKFYIKSVEQTNKGPEILVSRSHPELLRKLFKLEVPEISTGAVQIKVIARDAGARSKIAVMAKEDNLDPVGACIGQRGTRVQTIINELGGEKIDIIEWDEDVNKFIINALAPAKVLKIVIEKMEPASTREGEPTRGGGIKVAKAHVKEDQYSLAIGKGGQNVRLAAQLAGIKIDVVMDKDAEKTDNTRIDTDKKEEKKEKDKEIKKESKEESKTERKDEEVKKEKEDKEEIGNLKSEIKKDKDENKKKEESKKEKSEKVKKEEKGK